MAEEIKRFVDNEVMPKRHDRLTDEKAICLIGSTSTSIG